MKISLLIFITCILALTEEIKAQSANLEWGKSFGGNDETAATTIKTDRFGNIFLAGIYRQTTDFDPGPGVYNLSVVGVADIFVLKLDPAGNFQWVKSIGGTSLDMALSLVIDSDDNLYISGIFERTVDFDPGPAIWNMTSSGSEDIYVLKLDNNGNFIWAKSFGGPFFERGHSIVVDKDKNVYTTGFMTGSADFDSGPSTFTLAVEDGRIFISKLDSSGNFIWAKNFGGRSNFTHPYSITVDPEGNIFTTGEFDNKAGSMADFDPGPDTLSLTSEGTQDVYVTKFDPEGNLLWAKKIGGNADEIAYGIVADNAGNSYVTGWFTGTVDFDPGQDNYNVTAQYSDVFITKLDPDGNFVWVKIIGGRNSEKSTGIILDKTGNIYVGGGFSDSTDFDPGSNEFIMQASTGSDIFVSKFDPEGNFIWAKQLGAGGAYIGYITIDAFENVYTTGTFRGSITSATETESDDLHSTGDWDTFVYKFNQSTVGITENTGIVPLTIFPNPTTNIVSISHPFDDANERISIALYDIKGIEVLKHSFQSNDKINLELQSLAAGQYVLKVISQSMTQTKLITVIH